MENCTTRPRPVRINASRVKIRIVRTFLRFDWMDYPPDDGNNYRDKASYTWAAAAKQHLKNAGFRAEINFSYEKDGGALHVYITVGHSTYYPWLTKKYPPAVRSFIAQVMAVVESADEVGMDAAYAFAAVECAKYDAAKAEDDAEKAEDEARAEAEAATAAWRAAVSREEEE